MYIEQDKHPKCSSWDRAHNLVPLWKTIFSQKKLTQDKEVRKFALLFIVHIDLLPNMFDFCFVLSIYQRDELLNSCMEHYWRTNFYWMAEMTGLGIDIKAYNYKNCWMHVCIIAKAELSIWNNATLSMLLSIQVLNFSRW